MHNTICKTKESVVDYINTELQGYEGYVQFSHRPIDASIENGVFTGDIFINRDVKVKNEEKGFIYEAHFFNGKDNVNIRQINGFWAISENKSIDLGDVDHYIADIENFGYMVKMAQQWEMEEDEYCKGMNVKKLKKVIFAGFVEVTND